MRFQTVLSVWSMAICLCSPVLLISQAQGETHGRPVRIAYKSAISLLDANPQAGFSAMQQVANTGFPNALHRLAYYHQRGIGTEVDVTSAMKFYRYAIDQGSDRSLLSLGKLKMLQGNAPEAISYLTVAVDRGVKGAEATLALAHITGRFGDLSEPDLWQMPLKRLVESKDRMASIGALQAINRNIDLRVDVPVLVKDLTARAHAGDGRAAEALLVYHRLFGGAGRDNLMKRQALLQHIALRPKIASVEQLYYARDTQPARFWVVSEAILNDTPPSAYARALFVTSRINKNAYVRILQKELRELRLYRGRVAAYLNRPTIKAINGYCRKQNVWDLCQTGPLRSRTIKTVAQKIGEGKMDPCSIQPLACALPRARPLEPRQVSS